MGKYVDVIVNGRVYSIEYDNEEYAGRLSSFLNKKYEELSSIDGFDRQSSDYKNMMMQINIADDYLRCSDENQSLKELVDSYEHQLYELKHELITLRLMKEDSEA